ncbi:host HNS inhibition protein [Pseudomonas phage vB_PpuP-Vasula]
MAKTLKCNVSFGMTAICNTETVKALEDARVEARGILAENPSVNGEHKAMLEAFASERTTEALLELILRKGIREIVRKELEAEMNNGETSVRIGNIKVAFEAREESVPVDPDAYMQREV